MSNSRNQRILESYHSTERLPSSSLHPAAAILSPILFSYQSSRFLGRPALGAKGTGVTAGWANRRTRTDAAANQRGGRAGQALSASQRSRLLTKVSRWICFSSEYSRVLPDTANDSLKEPNLFIWSIPLTREFFLQRKISVLFYGAWHWMKKLVSSNRNDFTHPVVVSEATVYRKLL